jgi:DNA-binding beta-propeller fold protein YncE
MHQILLLVSLFISEPIITTEAGTGRQGYGGDGGPATSALLNQPFDVAFDSRGDLYFSDTFNHRIRKVEGRTGVIRSVAGSGKPGFSGDGGPATDAMMNEPYGVVLDNQGNLYFADRLNRRVRKVDAGTSLISTIAGTGQAESSGDGGPANRAALVEPNGVALDPSGHHLYIADVAAHRIRTVDLATGRMSTFAGTGRARHDGDGGTAARASIWGARAVDVGSDGTVYILEREGNSLRAVDPASRVITTIAGTGSKGYSGDGGPATQAGFNGPKELAVDRRGQVWVVDTENHAIRVVDPVSRMIPTVAGSGKPGGDGDGGAARTARLDRPHGVAVGPDGSIWIADTNNHRLRKVTIEP